MEAREYDLMAKMENSYWWYKSLQAMISELADLELKNCSKVRILDAGCGTGGMLDRLSEKFPRAESIGVDFSKEAIGRVSQRQKVSVIQSSVAQLPFQAAVFDMVLSMDVLYMQGVDEQRAVREAWRVLKPGGVLLVNLPAFEWLKGEHDQAIHTRHRYQLEEVKHLLAGNGFRVRKLFYWNFILLPVIFLARRFFRPQRQTKQPKSDLSPLPKTANNLFSVVCRFDTIVSRYLPIPFGTSILAVGAKT